MGKRGKLIQRKVKTYTLVSPEGLEVGPVHPDDARWLLVIAGIRPIERGAKLVAREQAKVWREQELTHQSEHPRREHNGATTKINNPVLVGDFIEDCLIHLSGPMYGSSYRGIPKMKFSAVYDLYYKWYLRTYPEKAYKIPGNRTLYASLSIAGIQARRHKGIWYFMGLLPQLQQPSVPRR